MDNEQKIVVTYVPSFIVCFVFWIGSMAQTDWKEPYKDLPFMKAVEIWWGNNITLFLYILIPVVIGSILARIALDRMD